jgi:hypothetical protein
MEEVTCPRCNVRIPADMPVCPFCRQPVAPGPPVKEEKDQGGTGSIRDLLVPQESFPGLKDFYRRHGRWLKLAVPVLVAIPVLLVAFLLVTRVPIDIPENPTFPIEVAAEKKGGRIVLLKGTLTNLGEDIPDLSLRSIGVTAEFRRDGGKVERKRVFPRSAFRGEGALFHGESGVFEIAVPPGVEGITLRAEIVNLGEDHRFNLPLQGGRRPERKK